MSERDWWALLTFGQVMGPDPDDDQLIVDDDPISGAERTRYWCPVGTAWITSGVRAGQYKPAVRVWTSETHYLELVMDEQAAVAIGRQLVAYGQGRHGLTRWAWAQLKFLWWWLDVKAEIRSCWHWLRSMINGGGAT